MWGENKAEGFTEIVVVVLLFLLIAVLAFPIFFKDLRTDRAPSTPISAGERIYLQH